MVILVFCAVLFVLCCIKYVMHIVYMESYLKNMKSISPQLPFIGNINLFMGKSLQTIFEEVFLVILKNSTPIKAQIGPAHFIIVDDPDDMKTILTSSQCLDKPYTYEFLHLPYGLVAQRCMKKN